MKQYLFGFYKNLYKTNYDKNVLISYITYPIRKGIRKLHTNYMELFIIIDVLKSLNFNIDLADYNYEGNIDYGKYDLIFGLGLPFGKSFYEKRAKRTIKICYMTGSLNLFNQMERNKYLKERKGVTVIPRRNYYWKYLQESISMSDAVITTGNEWTKSTITPYNNKVFCVRLPIYLPDKEFIINTIAKKDFDRARSNFLWFGSSGALHKGLDLCLDIFSKRTELFLHVCGPVDREEDFFDIYKTELKGLKNIKYYGFVDIDTDIFKDIVNSSGFSLFPSCSEGGGGSLLTTMAYGLVPICTKESSVDINPNYGFLLPDFKIEIIYNFVNYCTNLKEADLKNMSFNAIEYTFKNHNPDIYKQDLLNILRQLGVS